MNYKMIGRFLAQILSIEALFMIPALGISAGYGEWRTVLAFAITIAMTLAVAGVLYLICKKAPKALSAREGMVCVGISWIVLSLFGALPFVLSGDIPSPLNAPSGCPFRTRCRYATDICAQSMPEFKEVKPGHFCACHNLETVTD